VAYFDKAVSPGGEGKVTLSVRTKGYQGKIQKSATIISNDPAKKYAAVELTAFVKVSIAVSSRYVYLYGRGGQQVSRVVDIQAKLDKPLKITPTAFSLTGKMSYTIEEPEKDRHFRIRFSSLPGITGRIDGFLKLKTNYPQKSDITIWVRGRFEKEDSKVQTSKPKE
jgi:hypothetical protein